jgi:hypothetical protein
MCACWYPRAPCASRMRAPWYSPRAECVREVGIRARIGVNGRERARSWGVWTHPHSPFPAPKFPRSRPSLCGALDYFGRVSTRHLIVNFSRRLFHGMFATVNVKHLLKTVSYPYSHVGCSAFRSLFRCRCTFVQLCLCFSGLVLLAVVFSVF